ncbi:MAG: membrane protein insertase YidC [Proteobacteria bacterium]|jgi:YidC/Oxa1 family membrane protein insertase|nr:membrane protein insertase YidC [Pseudomonadota bacterium]MDA1299973.1 membrane protein insertase YidC [Pseudomonadota bacterium]
MDYQRIFILLGLAVTAYMLILKWNEDYGDAVQTPPTETVANPTDNLSIPAMGEVPVGEATPAASSSEMIPSLDLSQPATSPTGDATPVAAERLVRVESDVLNLVIDTVGGDIVEASLRRYPRQLGSAEPFVLVDPRNAYSAQSGIIGPNATDTAGGRPRFSVAESHYELGDQDQMRVVLTLDTPSSVRIRKVFELARGDYLVRILYEISNGSVEDWTGAMFAQIKRDGEDPHDSKTNAMGLQPYVGGATRTPEALFEKLEFDDVEEEPYRARFNGGYIAMVQHYFVTALVPEGEGEYAYRARKLSGQNTFLFGVTAPLITVPAGSEGSQAIGFYAGPKDQYRLEEVAEGLDLTVDYGFLWWLAQPLFHMLTFIQGFVVNWGVAIMILTLVVKLLLYPLSAASFRSNAKLRKLQPKMVRLKEQYGEDRQKFSQEMMALYKKEGANPLGGCLPLLLQMPVFIALYWVLLESVELRQAPFMLWIEDLAVMDPYFVLPILMGVSMYFVTLMQPEPPDPMQAKIFKLMPIMFTFFFLWFPAGLVLYWLVNNVLSIAQQWWVTRQLDLEK